MCFEWSGSFRDLFEAQFPHKMHFLSYLNLKTTQNSVHVQKVRYVDSIMVLVRLELNLIVSLFQQKCEVSETVSTTSLVYTMSILWAFVWQNLINFNIAALAGSKVKVHF